MRNSYNNDAAILYQISTTNERQSAQTGQNNSNVKTVAMQRSKLVNQSKKFRRTKQVGGQLDHQMLDL